MFKKNALASAIATSMLAVAAISGSAHAVQVDTDGRGQVLLAPIYMVDQGFETTVRIVNTSDSQAVKAKVVLRSKFDSQECRDFMVYLSPDDAAEFKIMNHPTNPLKARIYSQDDSIMSAAPDIGSSTKGGSATFANTTPYDSQTDESRLMRTEDTCKVGHIEVIGVYALPTATYTVPSYTENGVASASVTVARGMSKFKLYQLMRSVHPSTAGSNFASCNSDFHRSHAAFAGRSYSVGVNSLMSVVDLQKSDGSDRTSYKMVALRNEASSPLIESTTYDECLGQETLLGKGWEIGDSGDTLRFIDAALNLTEDNLGNTIAAGDQITSGLKGIYENNSQEYTNLLVAFPTKYRYLDALARTVPGQKDATGKTVYPKYFFPFNSAGQIQYNLSSYDMSEGKAGSVGCFESPCDPSVQKWMSEEVNYILTKDPGFGSAGFWYASPTTGDKTGRGWFQLGFLSSGTNINNGVSIPAVIGMTHLINRGQSTLVNTTR